MIKTTHPIQLGDIAVNNTTVSLFLTTQPTQAGVKASAVVIGQRFHRAESGACTPVGEAIRLNVADVYALAATDPAIAAEVAIITTSLERLAPLLQL